MGWNSQNNFVVLIVQAGAGFSGVFVYSPKPGAGNLIASITAQAGTDPFGNAFRAGITSYGGGGLFTEMTAGLIRMGLPGSFLFGQLSDGGSGSAAWLTSSTGAADGQGQVVNNSKLASSDGLAPELNVLNRVDILMASVAQALGIQVQGDVSFRFQSDAAGHLQWGAGGAGGPDTSLQRAAANLLETGAAVLFDNRAAPATPAGGVTVFADTAGTWKAKGSSGAGVILYGNDGLNAMAALGFQNGWTNGPAANVQSQYRQWYGNEIELIGSLTVPAGFAAGQVIVQLPLAYRPANGPQIIPGFDQTTHNAIELRLGTVGNFIFGGPGASTAAGNVINFRGIVSLDA